jgi:hypothetical protein
MLHDILALRDEAKKTLYALEQKLDIKNKSVEVLHKAKARKLKKGQEKRLQHYQKEKTLSENRLDTEVRAIQAKIQVLEDKITLLKENYNSTTKAYYNQIFEDLYESDTNQEDIKINQAHQELLTRVADLRKKIILYDEILDKDAKKAEDKLRAEFEATRQPKPEPQTIKPKTAKKTVQIVEPVNDEYETFKRAKLDELENIWRNQLKDICSLTAPLPEEGDEFYTQPELFLLPVEFDMFNRQGGLRSHLIFLRKEEQAERDRQREQEEKEALRQAELDRIKLIEKAKYGLGC